MNNGDLPASPLPLAGCNDGGIYNIMEQSGGEFGGLTKRENFAAMAMQGMMANTHAVENLSQIDVAKEAVSMADALLKELDK